MPALDGSKSNLKDLAGSAAPDPQILGLDWFYFQYRHTVSVWRGEKELAYFCLTNKHALPKDSASSAEASPSRRHKEALSGAETSEFYGKEVLQNVSVASMIPEGGKGYLPGSLTFRGTLVFQRT